MNVFPNSAEAMQAILRLHFPRGVVFDPTASLGVFYSLCPKRFVIRGDIRVSVEPDFVASAYQVPMRTSSVCVCVFDPPYKRGSRNRESKDHYSERYGEAPNNENAATKQYFRALPELLRVARRGLIVKLQDAADGHAFHDRRGAVTSAVREATGLIPHDIALVYRKTPMKTLTHGRRHYFRQQVSYFLIWKWRRKSPFRAYRY